MVSKPVLLSPITRIISFSSKLLQAYQNISIKFYLIREFHSIHSKHFSFGLDFVLTPIHHLSCCTCKNIWQLSLPPCKSVISSLKIMIILNFLQKVPLSKCFTSITYTPIHVKSCICLEYLKDKEPHKCQRYLLDH